MKGKILKGLTAAFITAALISLGSALTVTALASDYTYTLDGTTYDISDSNVYDMSTVTENVSISTAGAYYFSGTSTEYVIVVNNVADDVTLVLDNVNITYSQSNNSPIYLNNSGTTTIVLKGDNVLKTGTNYPGVYKNTTGYLIIADDEGDNSVGSLTATGGSNGAGIGGGYGGSSSNITINGGTVTATGGSSSGAGIGGGHGGSSSNITINGGTVTATGGTSGAGIGGGSGGSSNITINGGTVIATGGTSGAGIGSKTGGDIIINGGTVTATGKTGGAGISGSSITIVGGTVTATGKSSGAGISGSSITIKSGNVTANGGSTGGAGIDGSGIGSSIIINGGTVTANGGLSGGAGIDGSGIGSSITINGGTVTANGGSTGGAGIDGSGSSCSITINGGTVTATGGSSSGAGIDGSGSNSSIAINGGTVTATGGSSSGAGIDAYASAATITINGGTVTATGGGSSGAGIKGITSPVIGKASVLASSITVAPVNSEGAKVYLYTIPDTSEGDTIYIDGEEFISSVVHHSDDDNNQYLYLTDSAEVGLVLYDIDTAKYYDLGYENSTSSVEYVEDVILLNVDNELNVLDNVDNVNTSGISVVTNGDGSLSGIKVDTAVYGGESGAYYLDIVGVSVDGTFYQLSNYYYADENEQYAFFPVSNTSKKTSQRVRGAVGIKAEGAADSTVTYYVTEGSDGIAINAE